VDDEDFFADRIARDDLRGSSRQHAGGLGERERDRSRGASERAVRQAGHGVLFVQNERSFRADRRQRDRNAHVPAHAHDNVAFLNERPAPADRTDRDEGRHRGAE
jgi:hypothetical protein